ncbi:HARB1 nuclease, partial [Amia calva]|nr:HARB1 nuclease [Amia calva]
FSAHSIIHLNNILSPHVIHMTHRGHALSSEHILCVALCFFASGIICDAAHMISNVEGKWPGCVHDSRIFSECTLSARFARGEFDGYLLSDRGYPCQRYLLTPSPSPDPEPGPQQCYNLAHCRTRARVEMTIGMLKAQFQCLHRLRVTPERACDMIVACVILHNIFTIRGEQSYSTSCSVMLGVF